MCNRVSKKIDSLPPVLPQHSNPGDATEKENSFSILVARNLVVDWKAVRCDDPHMSQRIFSECVVDKNASIAGTAEKLEQIEAFALSS
jgi:hypothetical protein